VNDEHVRLFIEAEDGSVKVKMEVLDGRLDGQPITLVLSRVGAEGIALALNRTASKLPLEE
jgi:hypothetical protein